MATPTFSNTYEIEDTQTGKFYRVEGVDGTTREEAISWLETLDNDQLAQREIKKSAPVAVSNPVTTDNRQMETSIRPAAAPTVAPLPADEDRAIADMMADPNVPYSTIKQRVEGHEGRIAPTADEVAAFRKEVIDAGGEYQRNLSYESAATNLLGQFDPQQDPEVDNQWEAAADSAILNNPMNVLETWRQDLFDTDQGDINMESIRAEYPGLSDDEYENIHDSLIGERLRRKQAQAQVNYEANDVNPLVGLGSDVVLGASPVDLIPVARAAKLGERIAGQVIEGAVQNAAADGLMQLNDIAYGARQDYDAGQTAIAAGAGAALQGGIAAGTRVVSKRLSKAPTDSDGQPTVRVPQNRKGSKKYREQLTQTSEDVAEVINTATRDWQNKPDITVHDNFNDLEGIDSDAIGVYLGEGKVAVNSEAIVKEAKRINVDPSDITRAVTFHESLGHFGMAKQYGDDLDEVIVRWYDNNEGAFKESVDNWLKSNPKAYLNEPNRLARAAEEVLAEMSENGQIEVKLYDQIKNVIKNFARDMGFEWKVSDREVRSLLAMSHAQVGSKQAYARVTPNEVPEGSPRYMFVGSQAKNLSDKTRERLKQAQKLEARGSDVSRTSEIRKTLGWFKGQDGRWRTEVDDSNAQVRNLDKEDLSNLAEYYEDTTGYSGEDVYQTFEMRDALDVLADPEFQSMSADGGLYLDSVLKHDPVMDAYPALADLKVTRSNAIFKKEGGGGYFAPNSGTIYISPEESLEGAKSILLHEVQHAVQFLEGFSFGGSPSSALDNVPNDILFKGAKNYVKAMEGDITRLQAKASAYEHYVDHPTIKMARDLWNKYNDDNDDLFVDLAEELGVRIDEPGDLGYDQLDEMWNDLVLKTEGGAKLEAGKPARDAKKKQFELLQLKKGIEDKVPATVRRIVGKDKQAKFETYNHLYGEAEARDVQNRADWSVAERQEIPPLSSEVDLDTDTLIDVDPYGRSKAESAGNYMDVGIRSANDTDSTIKLDKNGRPILPGRVMGGRERLQYHTAMVNYYRRRADAAYRKGNVKQLEREKSKIERAQRDVEQAIEYLGQGGRRESSDVRPAVREYTPETSGYVAPEPANSRYMKPGRVDGSRVDVETMNADDLFESENALDLLRGMTSKYDPSVISFDDLEAEAEARGLNPSDILRSKTGNPGDVARRLMMYDIAAEKANNKLANLYNKMNSGQFTAKDKQEYLKTMAQAQEMFAKIFGEQSEAGRALRAIQNLNYTRKRMSNLEKALGGLQNATKNEEDFLRFMKEYHNSLDEQAAKKPSKIARFSANALNTPRALMSSLDLSAPLRQGIFLIGRKEFWKALPSMFKYFGSDDAYKSLMRDIVKRPTYPAMVKGKLAFSSLDGKLSSREEDFMSEWADKVPGVRPSNRAYTGFLNKLRADTFDSIYTKMQEAGVDFKADPKALKDLGTYISNATGRGDLGRFNSSAPLLTAALFSPRLLAARVNMLRPDLYYKMHPAVRKQALRDLALFGGAALTVATLGSLAGADVEIDPRSSDFGKLRVGNTRYDILGGFGQYLTLGARMAMFLGGSTYEKLSGEEGPDHYKTTSTGETKKYNDPSAGLYGQKAGGALTQFFRNKLAPVPSYMVDGFMGENVIGEEFSAGNDILKRVVPMFAQDVYEMANEYGTAQGVAMSAPGIFGVGVQNFTPTNLDPEAEVEAPESFTDNSLEDGENDFVTVKDGEVKLKPETQKEWQRRVNIYVQEWMKDEVAAPEWKTYTNKEKAEVIKEVRADARAQTKEDMMEVMGL
ncbi:MAG: hypothetical protein Unbinned2691contig1000_8 [Prokaryotic dsDNA virus sp.]|mgnify:CR=1 FL=1|nr:MAG: hypothetical protein Unbinned2691contig1000_8 [Prokaryotic dsDNA virus sp.]